MNIFLLDLQAVPMTDERVVLMAEQHTHLVKVLKSVPGDVVKVGFVGQGVWIAEVENIDDVQRKTTLCLKKKNKCFENPRHSIAIALPRPKSLRRLIENVSTLGIRHITLFNAWRVEKSYWQSEKLNPKTLEQYAWNGCQQGGHPWLPEIHVERFFRGFLEKKSTGTTRIALTPGGGENLANKLNVVSNEVIEFILGPEGGFIEKELNGFQKAGVPLCHLKLPILKTETAAAAVLTLANSM